MNHYINYFKQTKSLVVTAVTAAMLTMVGAAVFGYQAQAEATGATAAKECTIILKDGQQWKGLKKTADGKRVYGEFTITGDKNCRKWVSLAIWKMPTNKPHDVRLQKFSHANVKRFGPGTHRISTHVPDCYWQADILWQRRPKSIHGNAAYVWPHDKLAGFTSGGNKSCEKPKPKNKDITITKDVSATQVKVDEEFSYTINVQNTGEVDLNNVKITDTLPAGIVSVDNPDSNEITFEIAQLKVGESQSFTFQVKADESVALDTDLTNVACVVTTELPEEECDDAVVTVTEDEVPTPPVEPEPEQPAPEKPAALPRTGAVTSALFGLGAMGGLGKMALGSKIAFKKALLKF